MDRNPGRGSGQPDEPSKLANVARLHLDEAEAARAAATEDWYETERLTGHITGGACTPPAAQPAPTQDRTPMVLGWRHSEDRPVPTLLERVGRSLDARRYRPRRRKAEAGTGELSPSSVPARPRAHRTEPATLARASETARARVPQEEDRAADQIQGAHLSGPPIGLRGDSDQAQEHPRRRFTRRTRLGKREHHLRLRRGLVVSAVVLSAAALAVVAAVAMPVIGVGASHQPNGSKRVVESESIEPWHPLPIGPIRTAAALHAQSAKAVRPAHRRVARHHRRSTHPRHASSARVAHHAAVKSPQPAPAETTTAQTANPPAASPVTPSPTTTPASTAASNPAQSSSSGSGSSSSKQPAFGMNGALGPGHSSSDS